jgi:hypothetical protein
VSGGDRGQILRTFNDAVYEHSARMSRALPAVRHYLTHSDPFVRCTAARTLYVAGDTSGYSVLVELVRAPEPVTVRFDLPPEVVEAAGTAEQDLRVEAARVLGKYRQAAAADAIRSLYERAPPDSGLGEALVRLGAGATLPAREEFSPAAAKSYGLAGARQFVPDLAAAFERPRDVEAQVAIAWALAEMTGGDRYLAHLAALAREAIAAVPSIGEWHYDHRTRALMYLGAVRHPLAKQTLREALSSKNPVAVQYGLVNLLFNQGELAADEIEPAKGVLLAAFRRQHTMLGVALLAQLATSLEVPGIAEAGAQYNPGGVWYERGIERRNWPIYNWIDDYVIKLHPCPSHIRPESCLRGRPAS